VLAKQPFKDEIKKTVGKLQENRLRPGQTKRLIIWPSCLEEFDWPQVEEFEVAIRG
jgi:hypothetical protein